MVTAGKGKTNSQKDSFKIFKYNMEELGGNDKGTSKEQSSPKTSTPYSTESSVGEMQWNSDQIATSQTSRGNNVI